MTTGIDELRRATAATGRRLETELRTAARTSAGRIRDGMRALVRVRTGATRNAIVIVEAEGQVTVAVAPIPGRNPMVPVWIEYGTSRTPAQPFAAPALNAERANYARAGEAACDRVLREELA